MRINRLLLGVLFLSIGQIYAAEKNISPELGDFSKLSLDVIHNIAGYLQGATISKWAGASSSFYSLFQPKLLNQFDSVKYWTKDKTAQVAARRLRDPFGTDFCETRSIASSLGGHQLAAGFYDGIIRIWDVQTFASKYLNGHAGSIDSVAFSPDGKWFAFGSLNGTIMLSDRQTDRIIAAFQGHLKVHSLSFSPDSKRLASGFSDGTINVWDMPTDLNSEVMRGKVLRGHTASVSSVLFSSDGKQLISGSRDETIRIWDVLRGQELSELKGHHGLVYSLSMSHDGKRLAALYGNNVRVLDAQTWREIKTIRTPDSYPISSIALSPDGAVLAGGVGENITVWNAVTGENINELKTKEIIIKNLLERHEGHIHSLAFSSNGIYLASGSTVGAINVWSIEHRPRSICL